MSERESPGDEWDFSGTVEGTTIPVYTRRYTETGTTLYYEEYRAMMDKILERLSDAIKDEQQVLNSQPLADYFDLLGSLVNTGVSPARTSADHYDTNG